MATIAELLELHKSYAEAVREAEIIKAKNGEVKRREAELTAKRKTIEDKITKERPSAMFDRFDQNMVRWPSFIV